MNWDYIAGFFDGEGSIVKHGPTNYRISIPQTNEAVLQKIKKFSNMGNIFKTTKRKEHWKDSWVYFIAKQRDVLLFSRKIFDKAIVKKEAINRIMPIVEKIVMVHNKNKRLLQNKEKKCKLLRKKGLSYRSIGKLLGLDHGYVRRLIIR